MTRDKTPKMTLEEGKQLAQELAEQYGHRLGPWQEPQDSRPDWDAPCIKSFCSEVVGVDKAYGTLAFTEQFKSECLGTS